MNKYSLKDITLVNKNKESNKVLKLENKQHKFILYFPVNNENEEGNEHFEKLVFDKSIEITSKKKVEQLKLNIVEKDEKYTIQMKDTQLYYLKSEKTITSDSNYKLIMNNGSLYDPKNELDEKKETSNEIINESKEEEIENNLQNDSHNNEEKKEMLDTQSILSNLKSCSIDNEIEPIQKPKRNSRKKNKKISEPTELTSDNKEEDDKHTLENIEQIVTENTEEIAQTNTTEESSLNKESKINIIEDKPIDELNEDNIIECENIDHDSKDNEKIDEETTKEDAIQIDQEKLNETNDCETQFNKAEVCETQLSEAELHQVKIKAEKKNLDIISNKNEEAIEEKIEKEDFKEENKKEERDDAFNEETSFLENNSYFIKSEDKKDLCVQSQKKEKIIISNKQIKEKKQINNKQIENKENIFTVQTDNKKNTHVNLSINDEKNQSKTTKKDLELKNDHEVTHDNKLNSLKIEKIDHATFEENKETHVENNEEKKDISTNKNIYTEIEKVNVESINQDLFSLDKILNDFNQYFTSQSIHEDQNKKKNNINNNVSKKSVSFHNEDLEDIQNEIKKNNIKEDILNNQSQVSIMKKNILFNQQTFNITYSHLKQSKINIQNLFQSVIEKENRINQKNISLQLQSENSSYLLLYLENPYLLNKIDHSLIITNLKNRKSIQVNNQQYLLLGNCTFYLTENCSLLIPLIIKQEMNDHSGKMSHQFLPYI